MISRAVSNRKNASNMPAITGTPSTAVSRATVETPTTPGTLAIAGRQATVIKSRTKKMSAIAVTPTTSNSKDDSTTTSRNNRNNKM